MRRIAFAGVLALLLVLVAAPDALEARVGGGHTSSRGGGGGGGRSSGGSRSSSSRSSGGRGGPAPPLVFWHGAALVLGLIAMGMIVLPGKQDWVKEREKRARPGGAAPPEPGVRVSATEGGTLELPAIDERFSPALFLDFAQLVYTRAHEARGTRRFEPLRPYLRPAALAKLEALRPGKRSVHSVVIASARIVQFREDALEHGIDVRFEANLVEKPEAEAERFVRATETWTFARARNVPSKAPEEMLALGCPGCGGTVELRADGTCSYCGQVVTDGKFQWIVSAIERGDQELRREEIFGLGGEGGVEAGTDRPLVEDPLLRSRKAEFMLRYPKHDWERFYQHVRDTFERLQEAWSARRFEGARLLETDALFQTHRHWIERYQREGLTNKLDDRQVHSVRLSRIERDAFYDAITVRIEASMKDYTTGPDGNVVAGSATTARRFAEYWTFVRQSGVDRLGGVETSCPQCSAPLEVNLAGKCTHCEAKVTSGKFGWVLSRITQDEDYVVPESVASAQRRSELLSAGDERVLMGVAVVAALIPVVSSLMVALGVGKLFYLRYSGESGLLRWLPYTLVAIGGSVLWFRVMLR